MSTNEKEFKAKFTGDNSDLNQKMQESSRSVGSWAKKITGLIAGAFGVLGILKFGAEVVNLASKAEGVRAAFNALNKPDLLNDLRKATRGTVDDVTLMKKAMMAKNFKLPLEQLATYFDFATKRAIQTGESVDYLVDSIITGISRKSIPIMDNLGISSVEIQKEFAKTGDFAKAASNIVQRELASMGTVADTTGIKIASLKTNWQNFKTSLGESITASKTFGALMQWLADEAEIFSDKNLTFWQKMNGSPDDYKEWKKQQAELRDAWRQRLSQYTDVELQIRRGKMAEEEFNKQIELEIKERADHKKAIEEDLKLLKELNTHTETKHIPTIAEYEQRIKDLTEAQGKLGIGHGKEYEALKNEINMLQSAINKTKEYQTLIATPQIAPTETPTVAGLDLSIDPKDEAAFIAFNEKIQEQLNNIKLAYTSAQEAAITFAQELISASASGANSLKDFARIAVQTAKKVIATYIAQGVAKAVESALTKLPFPFNLVAGAIAGAGAAALFNSLVPNFAAGGAVSGPTLALVGEAGNISASNPEYIGTAAQLSQMGLGSGKLVARVSRGDLLFVLNEGKSHNINTY